ncbi:hypothetical protein OAS39_06730 [Pirellulales bacterium]|nr:hypothetical protein [Pirellulales bacterium]
MGVLALVLAVQPAAASNITMQLQQEGMNPAIDPTGASLLTIANAAAAFWEDALPQPGNYEVDIWWDTDEVTGTNLGLWTFEAAPADNNIRINADPRDADNAVVGWFIDPTPTDHGEYDFVTQDRVANMGPNPWTYQGGQWLHRDIDPIEQAFWFGGNPPDVMEVGFRGRAVSNPKDQARGNMTAQS